ncbi:MAG: hypothetical protein II821_09060 [Treponema sp.]|nr:hypothetical protein [Treponema sp.]
MKLIEAGLFLILLPLFAHICVTGKKAMDTEYQHYLDKVRDIYSEREIVNSFRNSCSEGKAFDNEEAEICEEGFKDGKTLLKMKWKELEVFGIKNQ